MKNIFLPVFATLVILSFSACKEEKSASNAPVQKGELQPIKINEDDTKPVDPRFYPTDGVGYVASRYAETGVNKYQIADAIVGDWMGPEGTSLKIEADGEEYKITVTNLDGPRTFPAKAVDYGIQFERDGKKELIRLADGESTGMKWLADKIDCVVINAGSEGFCRDQTEPTDAETK